MAILQVLGGLIAYSIKFVGHAMPLLCVGGTCIMAGNLAMAGLFTASSRDYTPAGRAGASQSVKMVIYIMLPMVLASIIDPLIIRAVALEPKAAILAKYTSYAGSYLYPYELFLAAAVSAVFMLMTFVVFVAYGLLAHAFRVCVIDSPRVQDVLRRTFAASFAGLGAHLALSER